MAVVVVVFRVIESLFGERISLAFRRTFFSYADLMTKIFGVTIDERIQVGRGLILIRKVHLRIIPLKGNNKK